MPTPPAHPEYVRAELHSLAHFLICFIEAAITFEPDPEEIEAFRATGGRWADHTNLAAYLHNFNIATGLEPLLPFRWFEGEGVPPACFTAIADLMDEVFERWGWPISAQDGFDESSTITDFPDDDPPATLTPDEVARFRRELRNLEWYIYTLPRGDEGDTAASLARPYIGLGDEAIDRLFSPIFFRTRRFLTDDGMREVGETFEDLKRIPAAYEAFLTDSFRKSFRIGQEGRHPDQARLVEIMTRARAFIVAVETCLPVEGEASPAPVGLHPSVAEFYACEAASALCDILDGPDGEAGESSSAHAFGWNTEVNYGLRSLDSLMGHLLTRWDVATWESRLAHGQPEPDKAVSIRPDELASLRLAVETIEKGLARLGIDATPEPPRPPEETQGREKFDKRWKIIKTYHDHPDWSLSRIAAEVGANRGHVSRVLRPLRGRDASERREGMPRGYRDREGDIDAWTA